MDIVEELREQTLHVLDGSATQCEVSMELLEHAANEIERLRSLCGCADVGASFRDLTKDLPRAERGFTTLVGAAGDPNG